MSLDLAPSYFSCSMLSLKSPLTQTLTRFHFFQVFIYLFSSLFKTASSFVPQIPLRAITTLALAVKRSTHSAKSHPLNSTKSHPLSAKFYPHLANSHPLLHFFAHSCALIYRSSFREKNPKRSFSVTGNERLGLFSRKLGL